MMKIRNMITICLLIGSIVLSTFTCYANVQPQEEAATGLISEHIDAPSLFDVDPEFNQEYQVMLQKRLANKNARSVNEDDGLSNYADLSTDEYFPEIGDQGSIGCCAAFAATYYQFTYAKNKYLDITTTADNTASPLATYNLVYNKGAGNIPEGGSTLTANYKVLQLIGAPTLEDFPYSGENGAQYVWLNDISVQREALNVRVENFYSEHLDTATSPITHTDDLDLMQIKYLVGAGYPLAFGTEWDAEIRNSSSFGKIIIRGNVSPENKRHAMTIVGYNDHVYYDANRDGSIEDAERGAFKVANSHGETYGNEGFIWVLYDALNVTSQITGNWEEDLTKTRHPFFAPEDETENQVSYIRVNNTKPLFVGELTVSTSNKSQFFADNSIKHTLMSDPNTQITSNLIDLYDGRGKNTSFSGKLLFPFNIELFTSNTNLHSIYCGFSVSDTLLNNEVSTTALSYRITDNLGNTVYSYGTFSLGNTWNTNYKFINKTLFIDAQPGTNGSNYINLQRGDVNFDGVIDSDDSSFILKIATKSVTYSYAQEFFADVNKDGKVSATDALAIM